MFQFVNEVAVFGTAFFMMAISTLWYSEYLFQKTWLATVKLTENDLISASKYLPRNIAITFGLYVLVVYIIAIVIGYAQVYELPVQKITILMSVGFAAFFSGFMIWEQRPLSYLFVTIGFSSIFILGSSFLLYNWPW